MPIATIIGKSWRKVKRSFLFAALLARRTGEGFVIKWLPFSSPQIAMKKSAKRWLYIGLTLFLLLTAVYYIGGRAAGITTPWVWNRNDNAVVKQIPVCSFPPTQDLQRRMSVQFPPQQTPKVQMTALTFPASLFGQTAIIRLLLLAPKELPKNSKRYR